MASLIQEKDGRRRIQFYDGNGKRRSIGLGSISERNAERIRDKVEQLVEHAVTGTPLDSDVSRWLAGLDGKLHEKLVKARLADARKSIDSEIDAGVSTDDMKLIEFFDQYLSQCGDLKTSSLTVYGNVRRNFTEFFENGKTLAEITEFDADNFRRFLKSKGYADATVNRRCGVAKTVAKAAVRHRLIKSNPFEHLATTVNGNPQKRRMISRETIDSVLEACPSAEWRLLVVLGRYGGMRVPSEPLSLRWCDIDWTNQKIHFRQPKNEHHDGRETRSIPLFPELVKPLLDVKEQSGGSGTEFVITQLRPQSMRNTAGNFENASLTTRFKKIITKAGLTAWPKPWVNLRASRDTELREQFPSHVVDEWIGHCEDIAKRHYLMVTDDHFAKAVRTKPETPVRKPVRYGVESSRTASQPKIGGSPKSLPCKEKRSHAGTCDRQIWTILDLNQ